MGSRFGSLRLATVPWSQDQEYVYGYRDGLPLLKRNMAPRHLLATDRQLDALGIRPNGQPPVAVLLTKHRASAKFNFSSLWMIATCVPKAPMTPARWASIRKATAARRICRECGETAHQDLPYKFGRRCEACRYSLGLYDDALHDELVGEPTLTAAEHDELDQALAVEDPIATLAQVIPLQRARSTGAQLCEVAS